MSGPPILLPYQARFVASQAPVKILEKSRQIGMTWSVGIEKCLVAGTHGSTGRDVWYMGYDEASAIEFIDEAGRNARNLDIGLRSQGIKEYLLDDGSSQGVYALRIDFKSGRSMHALTSNPRKFRSKHGDAVIDEAAFHDNLESVMKAAMAFRVWGGSVTVMSTHLGAGNPFNKMLQSARNGTLPYEVHRITFREAVGEGLFKRICLVNGNPWSPEAEAQWVRDIYAQYGDDAPEELDCNPSSGGGVYFSTALIESCMDGAPVLRYEAPESFATDPDEARTRDILRWCDAHLLPHCKAIGVKRAFAGMDFGRSANLTDLVVGVVDQDMRRRVRFILELGNVPFEQQRVAVHYCLSNLTIFSRIYMDATGNGAYLAESTKDKYGSSVVECVNPTAAWYAEHFPPLKDAFEQGLISIPTDRDVMEDLLAVRVIQGIPRLPPAPTSTRPEQRGKGLKRHGDAAIALVMFHASTRNETTALVSAVSTPVDSITRPLRSARKFIW